MASDKKRRKRADAFIRSRYEHHGWSAAKLAGDEPIDRYLAREDHSFEGCWYSTWADPIAAIKNDLTEECSDHHPLEALLDLDQADPDDPELPLDVLADYHVKIKVTRRR